jgi:hypothetical protein
MPSAPRTAASSAGCKRARKPSVLRCLAWRRREARTGRRLRRRSAWSIARPSGGGSSRRAATPPRAPPAVRFSTSTRARRTRQPRRPTPTNRRQHGGRIPDGLRQIGATAWFCPPRSRCTRAKGPTNRTGRPMVGNGRQRASPHEAHRSSQGRRPPFRCAWRRHASAHPLRQQGDRTPACGPLPRRRLACAAGR